MNAVEMMAAIDEIAATSSKNAKHELVASHIGDEFFRSVLVWTYDPFITFGLTPKRIKGEGVAGVDDFERQGVQTLLQALRERRLTGNAARDAVAGAMKALAPQAAELLFRVLSKDIKAGFTGNTINRVLPGTVPSFDVMLAHPYEEKRIVEWPVAVEHKLDGLRTVCVTDLRKAPEDDKGGFFSRAGRDFPALEPLVIHVRVAAAAALNAVGMLSDVKLQALFRALLGNGHVAFDGEILTGSFNTSSGDVKRKSAVVDPDTARYYVFDILPAEKFLDPETKSINIPYRVRRAFLEWVISFAPPFSPLRIMRRDDAANAEEVQALYASATSITMASFLAEGDAELEAKLLAELIDKKTGGPKMLEGVIVKPLEGPYEFKRSHSWTKIKGEETEDLRITGWFEGKDHTKLEGKFGGFLVDRDGVECRVGGGFSDAQREEFERDARTDTHEGEVVCEKGVNVHRNPGYRGEVLGRLIEVEYHEVTPDGALRHPRFVRWRDDKDVPEQEAA